MKYYYYDNWMSLKHSFRTLTEARQNAKKETGEDISIYNMKGKRIQTIRASGFTFA